MRRPTTATAFHTVMSLVLAMTVGLARTEKIWAQNLNGLQVAPVSVAMPAGEGHEPFDPRRVPQSGGAGSRLLAGISVKHA